MSFDQTIRFDGNDLSPYILVTDVGRRVMPGRRITKTQIPGMDGALVSSVELDPVEITVSACIKRRLMPDVEEARIALAAMMASREPAPLVLPDSRGTYLMAVYEGGAEPSSLISVPDVELVFLCADPVSYGQSRRQEISGEGYVVAGGTYRSKPVVTARPPAGESWQITNVDTGEFVRVYADFDGSQEVVLDFPKSRCTVNGADHRVDVESDFFFLEGTRKISVSSGSCTLEWAERWL